VKISSQEVAVLKYNGGGDWYSNQTAVPNLIKFANKNSNTKIKLNQGTVAVGSIDLFNFPVVFMTGHGNVFFTEQEAQNLRNYLTSGGFLHVSDNYGLDKYIRREMNKVFPKLKLLLVITPFIIKHLFLKMESLKFTNMIKKNQKVLDYFSKVDWYVFMITNLI